MYIGGRDMLLVSKTQKARQGSIDAQSALMIKGTHTTEAVEISFDGHRPDEPADAFDECGTLMTTTGVAGRNGIGDVAEMARRQAIQWSMGVLAERR